MVTGCEFCSGGDCGSGGCGAGGFAERAMEAVSSFKHIEVFKKMNFIFVAVCSGGFGGSFGGGGIEEEDDSSLRFMYCFFLWLYPRFLTRSEIFSFPFD